MNISYQPLKVLHLPPCIELKKNTSLPLTGSPCLATDDGSGENINKLQKLENALGETEETMLFIVHTCWKVMGCCMAW